MTSAVGWLASVTPNEDKALWTDWAAEIFADWYGLMTMGQWIVWAMAQFEIADRATMIKRRGPYPAPLPPCFTVTNDRGVWDDAVAAWKLRHGVAP